MKLCFSISRLLAPELTPVSIFPLFAGTAEMDRSLRIFTPAKRSPSFLALTIAALALCSLGRSTSGQVQEESSAAIETTPVALAEGARTAVLVYEDYDQAIHLLRKAISLNPDDEGAKYDPLIFHRQPTDDSEHGQTQVKRMLRDRLAMVAYVEQSDDLWKWAAWKFGKKIGERSILWDRTPPDRRSFSAEHAPPYRDHDGKIRIRDIMPAQVFDNQAVAFEKLWRSAIFELHNIDNASDFIELDKNAAHGTISEEEYVRSMFALEVRAMQRTRKWYVEVYLPHAKKYKINTYLEYWYFGNWESATSQFNQYTDKESYPWTPYSGHYRMLKAGRVNHLKLEEEKEKR